MVNFVVFCFFRFVCFLLFLREHYQFPPNVSRIVSFPMTLERAFTARFGTAEWLGGKCRKLLATPGKVTPPSVRAVRRYTDTVRLTAGEYLRFVSV